MEQLSQKDKLMQAAKNLSPAKFISLVEDHFKKQDNKLEIEILNKDEIFNINRGTVKLKIKNWIFVFTDGVFQDPAVLSNRDFQLPLPPKL